MKIYFILFHAFIASGSPMKPSLAIGPLETYAQCYALGALTLDYMEPLHREKRFAGHCSTSNNVAAHGAIRPKTKEELAAMVTFGK